MSLLKACWGWCVRLAGGFLPTNSQKTAKLIWVSGICLAVIVAYNFLTKSDMSTAQRGGDNSRIASYGVAPHVGFGCSAIKIQELKSGPVKKTPEDNKAAN